MKAVEVVWQDAYDVDSWFSKAELDAWLVEKQRSGVCHSLGWLYLQDDTRLVLVMTHQPDVERADEESVAGALVIPVGMVIEVREFGEQ